jgi:hypothetical protein
VSKRLNSDIEIMELKRGLIRAMDELHRLRDAMQQIAAQQPKTLATIERNGFVFDDIGTERGNWQHLAFSIYTDLCEVDTIARAALREQ